MPAPLLQVCDVTKSYGSFRAVDHVSFAIHPGQCVGLIGPNGAGKTTTLAMIAGLMQPDSGQVLIDGRAVAGDADPLKARLGIVPQELALYDELTAAENLRFFGSLYSLDKPTLVCRIQEALQLVGLADRAAQRVAQFSGGMKRRLNLAAALLHRPALLLLDEPTVGVDPQSRNAIFDNIQQLRAQGAAVLYTTHHLEEVDRLCDRVVVMDHGRVLADAAPAQLRASSAGDTLLVDLAAPPPPALLDQLRQLPQVKRVARLTADGGQLRIELTDLTAGAAAALGTLGAAGQTIVHLQTEQPGLEAAFLSITGHQLRDDA
jgi:ABC-2 type transport system ATP-binding protein